MLERAEKLENLAHSITTSLCIMSSHLKSTKMPFSDEDRHLRNEKHCTAGQLLN